MPRAIDNAGVPDAESAENLESSNATNSSDALIDLDTGKTACAFSLDELDPANRPINIDPAPGADHDAEVDSDESWRAAKLNWEFLRLCRNMRAWQLCALALGLKPESDIVEQLKTANQVDKLEQYKRLRTLIKNNLTSDDDLSRLRYVRDAENDGRLLNPENGPKERVVDVVEFVRFAESRGITLPMELTAIADHHRGRAEPSSQLSPSINTVPVKDGDKPSRRDELVIGLLMSYIRDLAIKKVAPDSSVIKGSKESPLNVVQLAIAIHLFAKDRTDLEAGSSKHYGVSVRSLRDSLGRAADRFAATTAVEDPPLN